MGRLRKQPDPEELFLLSLAHCLRRLSEEKKSLVEMEFMQALHRVERYLFEKGLGFFFWGLPDRGTDCRRVELCM